MITQVRSFTTKYDHLSLALYNEVVVSQAFDPGLVKTHPPLTPFKALWDTGATNTVITDNVVQQCGLQPIDIVETHTAGGKKLSKVYLVSLGLPNKVMITSLRVTDGILIGGIDVLIGMDIISKGDLAITNHQGKTVFSFRIPSLEEINFIQPKKPVVQAAQVGRNQLCPCGSGKKYKNCCNNK